MALNPNAAPPGEREYENPYFDAQDIVVGTPFTPCRAIYNGAAQDVTVTLVSGNSVQLKALPIGIYPLSATNVSVAASGLLVALY